MGGGLTLCAAPSLPIYIDATTNVTALDFRALGLYCTHLGPYVTCLSRLLKSSVTEYPALGSYHLLDI